MAAKGWLNKMLRLACNMHLNEWVDMSYMVYAYECQFMSSLWRDAINGKNLFEHKNCKEF